MKKTEPIWSLSIFPSFQLVVYCTPVCVFPWVAPQWCHFVFLSLSCYFLVSVCPFTDGSTTIAVQHIVVNTCGRNIKLWAMPRLCLVLIGYMPL